MLGKSGVLVELRNDERLIPKRAQMDSAFAEGMARGDCDQHTYAPIDAVIPVGYSARGRRNPTSICPSLSATSCRGVSMACRLIRTSDRARVLA